MPDIIGEALEDYVIKQIKDRQELHGSGVADSTQPVRDTNIISLLNSNTSWIKLASGVKVSQSRLDDIGVTNVLPGSDLAKKYVLYSGFSEYSSGKLTQREGFIPSTQDTVNSSYTYGEYGYSPMPGIISADIKALNRGSIKKASVKLKAHNKQQFGIIDYLYLRLGYTVLLEWGNSIYVTKEGDNLVTKKMGSTLIEDKFFESNNTSHKRYADLIETYRNKYDGNYDGLLCKVSNFSWTFNDDGSYDIDITLISLGDVVESLKTNVPIDKGSLSFITNNIPTINQADADLIDKNAKSNTITSMLWLWKYFNTGSFQFVGNQEVYIFAGQQYRWVGKFLDNGAAALSSVNYTWNFFIQKDPIAGGSTPTPLSPKTYPNTLTGDQVLAEVRKDVDNISAAQGGVVMSQVSNTSTLVSSQGVNIGTGERITVYAEPVTTSALVIIANPIGGARDNDAFQLFTEERQNYLRFGFLLQYMDGYCIPKVQTDNEPLFKIATDEFGPKMLFEENQISLDPRVCIVKNDKFEKFDPNGGYKATAQIGTRSTAGEPELRDWIEQSNRDYAYPLNIYLNFNFIIDSLTSATDERGDINVFSFLSNICNGLNKALGGINNLEPTIDERTNTLHIIDSSLTNQGKDKPYSLKILGYSKQGNVYESNFIRKIDLKTAITPEYATMITIGATAGGYVKGTEGTAFSEWNTGLTDRFKEKIIPANPASAPSTPDEAVSNYYAEIADKISECYGFLNDSSLLVPPGTACYGLKFSDNIISKNISIGTEYLKYQLSQNKKSSVGFIPFKLGLKMDGLSGIRIYNKINIDSSYLPPNYGASLDFIVTGVNHSLSGNDWETEISTMVVPGSQKKPIVRPSTPRPSITSSLPPTPPTPPPQAPRRRGSGYGGLRGDLFAWAKGPNYPDPSDPNNYNNTRYPYSVYSDPPFTPQLRQDLLNWISNRYMVDMVNDGEASIQRKEEDWIQKPANNPAIVKLTENKSKVLRNGQIKTWTQYKYYTVNFTQEEQTKMFKDILAGIGAPATQYNLLWMKLWRDIEGGSATYNPWNSTQKTPTSTLYNEKVQNYFSYQEGLNATIKTLLNGNYPTIIKALRKGLSSHAEMLELAKLTQLWDITGRIPAKWQ